MTVTTLFVTIGAVAGGVAGYVLDNFSLTINGLRLPAMVCYALIGVIVGYVLGQLFSGKAPASIKTYRQQQQQDETDRY